MRSHIFIKSIILVTFLFLITIFQCELAKAQQFNPLHKNPFSLTEIPDGVGNSGPTFADLDGDLKLNR